MTFPGDAAAEGGGVRNAAFEPRSTLPLSAACLVASGVRERLCELLAVELEVALIEPAMPGPGARRFLVQDATIFRVRGSLCDAFVVVRAADARRLVGLAFREHERAQSDELSDIEGATLERIARALVPLCNALCGTLGAVSREGAECAAGAFATYFEVRTEAPVRISVGFALTRDPAEAITDRLALDDVGDVEVRGRVEFGVASLAVPAFSQLAAGATVALDTAPGAPGVLLFGDVAFARGTCGAIGGRSALAFELAAGDGR